MEHRTVRVVLPILVALAAVASARAEEEEGKWTLRFEPIQVQALGHDQHVLTIHEIDSDGTPQTNDKTAVSLDTESGLAYGIELVHTRGVWSCGVNVFWFDTSQGRENRTAAAEGPSGTIDQVVFEIADREFTSSDPSEILFFEVLEDTDLAVWTVDLYGARTLAETPQGRIQWLFGLRLGDFDNDYRAVVGVQDVEGSRLDASSNYDRMMGPIVGLAGEVRHGRSELQGYLRQSVLFGSAELSSVSNEFTGPVGSPSFFAREAFQRNQDVAIPITEFRLGWTYRVARHVALSAGAQASAWWDVSVPPGVIPGEGGDEVLHENTIVFFGLLGAVEVRF